MPRWRCLLILVNDARFHGINMGVCRRPVRRGGAAIDDHMALLGPTPARRWDHQRACLLATRPAAKYSMKAR